MKWFWGSVLVLVIVAGVAMLRSGRQQEQRADSGPSGPARLEQPGAAPAPAESVRHVEAAPAPVPAVTPDPTPDPTALSPNVDESPAPIAAAPTEAIPAFDDPLLDVQKALDRALGIDSTADAPTAAVAPARKPELPQAPSSPPPASAPKPDAAAKATLEAREDGSVLVDGEYVVKGTGTEADPFLVSWEMLVSAQDTYQPRLGRKEIPERLKMISGKWVRISGYIAFPIMAQSADEMLMMLNQWDGCCIGVPPTPYDAIEVKLKKSVAGDDRLRVSGTIKGILRVDPYLIKDWLVSLYLMDDAELVVEKSGAVRAPGEHAK